MSTELYVNKAFTPVMATEEVDYVDVDVNEIKNGHDQNHKRNSSSPKEDKLRKKLKFFLANPCQRWCMEGVSLYQRIPIKLIIQCLKIIFVTTQLLLVGQERSRFGNYFDRSNIALKRLFLKSWITQYETMPYPPASGVYGIYHIEDLYSHVNFAVNQFRDVPKTAMGSYYFVEKDGEPVPMEICMTYYDTRAFYPNGTLLLNPASTKDCFSTSFIPNSNNGDHNTSTTAATTTNRLTTSSNSNDTGAPLGYTDVLMPYDVKKHFEYLNIARHVSRLLEIKLNFQLHSVRLDTTIAGNQKPDCFKHDGEIIFDNTDRNGQLLTDLVVTVSEFPCSGSFPSAESKRQRDMSLAVTVIVLNFLSLFFCIGAIRRATCLLLETKEFFRTELKKELECGDQVRFIKHWDILTIINDVLTVIGTALRLVVEQNSNSNLSSSYDAATTLLGVGCLFVWLGILRYFAYFPKFYILFLTLNKAVHSILRYMVCCSIIYAGFVFCGWAVLGPYHLKFKSLQSTAECLFATINGDDLFGTLSNFTVAKDEFIWWFSRFFMFVYIALFTAIAINLFIAILTDTYETIKQYCKHGFPMSDLLEFIYKDEIYSPLRKPCNYKSIFCCLCSSCSRVKEDEIYEN